MNCWVYVIIAFLQLSSTPCYGYRILAIFPWNGRSHFNVLSEIAKSLAEKGHQVDVISYFPLKEKFPNYTDLIELPKSNNAATFDFGLVKQQALFVKNMHIQCQSICKLLEHPEISNLINNPPTDSPYDALLAQMVCGYPCFTAIGNLWDIPVISITTTTTYAVFDHLIGSPLNLASASRNIRDHKENMTFWDRLYNFVTTHHLIWAFLNEGNAKAHINKYFGDRRLPSYTVLEKSTSLILSNSHNSLYGVRPKVPALIEIGGIHITDDNSTLNATLKSLMDKSKDGFLYVSFGTRLIVESFPREVLNNLFAAFEKIAPIPVIMKSEKPHTLPESVSKNVHFFSWLPQKQILQHPNIKAFFTHGGGLSTQEAVYYSVPIICTPVYADQFVNCDIASNKKFGLKLDITTAKREDYFDVFDKILNNSTYQKSAKKLSLLYRDRLKSPREEAAYWTEYVIKHGKNILRSPTVDLEWWQVELLDVLAFIAVCMLLTVAIAIFAVKQLLKLVVHRSTKSKSNVQKIESSKKLK